MGSPLYGRLALDGVVIADSYESGSLLWSAEGPVPLPRNSSPGWMASRRLSHVRTTHTPFADDTRPKLACEEGAR
jgi:hypothetical protein